MDLLYDFWSELKRINVGTGSIESARFLREKLIAASQDYTEGTSRVIQLALDGNLPDLSKDYPLCVTYGCRTQADWDELMAHPVWRSGPR